MLRTWCPRLMSNWTRLEPMKPAPPVTRIRIGRLKSGGFRDVSSVKILTPASEIEEAGRG
jgi:hypothetical protein